MHRTEIRRHVIFAILSLNLANDAKNNARKVSNPQYPPNILNNAEICRHIIFVIPSSKLANDTKNNAWQTLSTLSIY